MFKLCLVDKKMNAGIQLKRLVIWFISIGLEAISIEAISIETIGTEAIAIIPSISRLYSILVYDTS